MPCVGRFRCRGDSRDGSRRAAISSFSVLVRVAIASRDAVTRLLADDPGAATHCGIGHASPLVAFYLAPVTPLRKSEGDMPASLRNDLLNALSEPKPESMATRSTLAS